jgi:tRNA(fMet)-specific endonuclease VapC
VLLLDTDILVDIRRSYQPADEWLGNLEQRPAIGFVVVLELLQGCRNKQEMQQSEQLMSNMIVLYPAASECKFAVEYIRQYRLSHGLGVFDALIAACAVSREATLCTFNRKHYQCISELETHQPYERL